MGGERGIYGYRYWQSSPYDRPSAADGVNRGAIVQPFGSDGDEANSVPAFPRHNLDAASDRHLHGVKVTGDRRTGAC